MRSANNIARWHDRTVRVTADFISRYLWTTASIDVFSDDECVIGTGGVWRIWGTQRAEFRDRDEKHIIELSWQSPARGIDFPYRLSIDGLLVQNSKVRPLNWYTYGLIGFAVIIIVVTASITAVAAFIDFLRGRI